jgi:hypothetical protein
MGLLVVVVIALAGTVGLLSCAAPAGASRVQIAHDTGPAIGAIDSVSVRFDDRHTEVSGWAADPDQGRHGTAIVNLYVGGQPIGSATDGVARPDVAAAYPWAGTETGWSVIPEFLPGWGSRGQGTRICAYAQNREGPGKSFIGCQDLAARGPSPFNPIGSIDAVAPAPGWIRLQGWAADPDGDLTTQVQVLYDGQAVLQRAASMPRPDVADALGFGATAGFDLRMPIAPGPHVVCVRAQNTGLQGRDNPTIGCTTPVIPGVQPAGPHDPAGSLDAIDAVAVDQNGVFRWGAKGWAYDPDSGGPIGVRVRTLGKNPTYRAPNTFSLYDSVYATGQPRPDVEHVVPAAGPDAGFEGSHLTLRNPEMTLTCAYAVNTGPGVNRFIGCIQPRHL